MPERQRKQGQPEGSFKLLRSMRVNRDPVTARHPLLRPYHTTPVLLSAIKHRSSA
jgi:hypothetical protein